MQQSTRPPQNDNGQEFAIAHVSQQRPSTKHTRTKYRGKLGALGCIEITIGLAAALMSPSALGQEMGVSYRDRGPYYIINKLMPGLWVGVFMFTSGILGVCTARNHSYSMYIANLVVSIITVVLSLMGLVISFTGAALSWNTATALHVLITLSIFVGLCLGIIHAILSFKGIRRKDATPHQGGISYNRRTELRSSRQIIYNFNSAEQSNSGLQIPHTKFEENEDPPPPYPY